jgi:RecA-family ATPase
MPTTLKRDKVVFSQGDRVRHSAFGSGVITASDPMDSGRLIVRFDAVGCRKMRSQALQPVGLGAMPPSIASEPHPKRAAPHSPLKIVTASVFAGQIVPPREWQVEQLIPAKTVTILNGDGGTGKSLLATQLAVATVSGSSWIGSAVSSGPVLYLSAEDDLEELHRRIATIGERRNIALSDLHQLSIIPLAGEDALLASPEGRGNILKASPLFAAIEAHIALIKPVLVVLDTLADLFGGDENQRAQARQFVGLLRGWAIKHQTTILLLAHPSLSGMANGTGSSGNTAWNNSVRSRLYLERVTENTGNKLLEPDPDARVLRTVKSNYGRTGGEIPLRWSKGILVPDMADLGTDLRKAITEQREEQVFINLLKAFAAEGRHVSATPSANYAPAVFAKDIRAENLSRRVLVEAMGRLFARRRIEVKEEGPKSRRRRFLRPTNA